MHNLLRKQIKRHLGGSENVSVQLAGLFDAVSSAYEQADADRALLERSLELTSREFLERYEQLQLEMAERTEQERAQRRRADRLRLQNEAMIELTRSARLTEGDLSGAIRHLVELGARYLDVARMGVWVFDEDRARLRCLDRYDMAGNTHQHELNLHAAEHRAFIRALEAKRTITADRALAHPDTRELTAAYLTPNRITSLMAAAIRRGALTVGVVSCEHVGSPRTWSPEEELFAASLADIAALTMEAAERRRAEKEVEHSLSLLRATLESTADGILVVDLSGKILSFNQRFVDMWRIPDEIIRSRDDNRALDFVLDQLADPEAFLAKVRDLYAKPAAESEDVLRFRDGRVFERVSRPQKLGSYCIGRVWSFRDVTESRRAQEELLKAKRLEAAGQLAGQIAHDFNNLLTPMVAYPDLMRRIFPVNEKTERILKKMEKSAQQIAEINQQLLTLGRRGHYNIERYDPNELLDAALHVLQIRDGIRVERAYADNLQPLSGGAAQILRVLTNLIANAADAMEGAGTLRLETRNARLEEPLNRNPNVTPGDYVAIRIADTGPGIPTDIQDKIFEPFFSTKKTDKKRGSGLGLSVVHSVIEDHKGYIDLESEPGRGTAFTLYLPVDASIETPTVTEDGVPTGSGARVLMVDDDPMQRDVVTTMLESIGYETSAAASGEEAVALLCRTAFDLVILDMQMDGIDGAETLRQIKIIRPEQRAIILSGFARSDRVNEAMRLGARSYLAKPVPLKTLAKAVHDALRCAAVAAEQMV